MSLGIAADLQPVVADLGTSVTIETRARVRDQAAGTVTDTVTTQIIKGAVESVDQRLVDGTNVQAGDLKIWFLAPDLNAVPERETSRVLLLGRWYLCVAVEPVLDGDSAAAYGLLLRGT